MGGCILYGGQKKAKLTTEARTRVSKKNLPGPPLAFEVRGRSPNHWPISPPPPYFLPQTSILLIEVARALSTKLARLPQRVPSHAQQADEGRPESAAAWAPTHDPLTRITIAFLHLILHPPFPPPQPQTTL